MASGVICGAIASHFFDSDRGHARRARARDQIAAMGRRVLRRVERASARRLHYTTDRAAGVMRRTLHNIGREQPDDTTISQKVRSEILGTAAFRHHGITVDTTAGVVHVRGELPTQTLIDELTTATGGVYGVGRVESYLHLPGEPAPNKQPVLASHHSSS